MQLIKRQIAKAGKAATKNTNNIKGKLYRKLISCEINTGTIARIPISSPKTAICHGYSNMLTPAKLNRSRRQSFGEITALRLNDHKEPLTISEKKRHARPNATTASSQHLCTFLWL